MSSIEQKKKIEAIYAELCVLLSKNDYDLQTYEIIQCSQKLDQFIVDYMRKKFFL
ncbi:aspartyl-phosphate phosphatase Spo0E family protein [Inediibacterium massiliense]|uniref:aspartyl-phosphate phosphatase Spo0E family protein n=1 Tax=Inediibacterium massiliense TaxID=1658111 RepID=UPI000DA5F885|nr:aspartyl-phosphate phosphatase Spo0E family protein [Inediibacterium massiliense]